MERRNSCQLSVVSFQLWMGIFIAVFFALYVVSLYGTKVFNSPDENANAVFTQFFAAHGSLQIPALYRGEGAEYLTPRSVMYRDGFYVPGSFIGLPLLYGSLLKITQLPNYSITFFTPLFAILGLLAFFGIIRRIFSDRFASISIALLGLHPAFWYWASRGMMPNILFVSLFLVGLLFLIRMIIPSVSVGKVPSSKFQVPNNDQNSVPTGHHPKSDNYQITQLLNYGFAGLFIGLALLVRTFDMLLLAPIIIALLWRKSFWSVVSFLVPIALAGILLLNLNTILYGSPFTFAYVPPTMTHNVQLPNSVPTGHLPKGDNDQAITNYSITQLLNYLFPFGFHPRLALKNFLDYGVELFWWWSIPLGYGLWVFVRSHVIPREARNPLKLLEGIPRQARDDKQKWYCVFLFYVFFVFVLIYGSGQFFDHPDHALISIGNSYTRYWLPLYILLVPFVAYGIDFILSFRRKPESRPVLIWIPTFVGMTIIVITLNVYTVLWGTDVSLLSIRHTLQGYQTRQEKVLSLTPPNAIVVAGRYDKLFWPSRTVVFSLSDVRLQRLLLTLLRQHPLYYYSWDASRDTHMLNQLLQPLGLMVVGHTAIHANEALLQIKAQPRIM